MKNILASRLRTYWKELYPGEPLTILENFIIELEGKASEINIEPHEPEWYKDAIVYSLYVDFFNNDFKGLEDKLDYLKDLGISCLWLLPILDSPMKDAGFDIKDYRKIRPDLVSLDANASNNERQQVFVRFLEHAHQRGIKVIFDIAINHTSNEHPWFKASCLSRDNPFRDYYIWSDDREKYREARIIFKGLCSSNWEKDGGQYFFHRFFEFQPDLNYRNPSVLLEMSRNFVFWMENGVDGFRADAIPYLWKEEGTDCENLPKTHTIIKFFRAVIELLRPGTLLLAEACQQPHEVVKYFGDGDECNAGYHFPLMPQMFKALASQSNVPVVNTLSPDITPDIPESTQWFLFLRLHDELSLELVYVSEEDRKFIHEAYCKDPRWDFRLGQGISARLSELMDRDPRKIALIYSIMLTLPGTPVVYYGDEFGKLNDVGFYERMIQLTGKDDTRFLVRGEIDWDRLDMDLSNHESFHYKVFMHISMQTKTRKMFKCFGQGSIDWVKVMDQENNIAENVLTYIRSFADERIWVIHNLSPVEQNVILSEELNAIGDKDLLGKKIKTMHDNQILSLPGFSYFWFQVKN
jgi:maltose alpha-D-glucosyltransferase/alpha-amylase